MSQFFVNTPITFTALPHTEGFLVGDHTCNWTFNGLDPGSGLTLIKTFTSTGSVVAVVTATNNITHSSGTASKAITVQAAYPFPSIYPTPARMLMSGTLLPDGTVSFIGGSPDPIYGNQCDNYTNNNISFNPATGAFTAKVTISTSSQDSFWAHDSILLGDGRILVCPGLGSLNGAVSYAGFSGVYNPSANTFTPAPSLLNIGVNQRGFLRPDGKAVLCGGHNQDNATPGSVVALVEIFDPSTNTFSAAPNNMLVPRFGHSVVVMVGGKTLISGGYNISNAEVYDPSSQAFVAVSNSMSVDRYFHGGILMANGKVLIAGGQSYASGVTNKSDIYDPGSNLFSVGGNMSSTRLFPGLLNLPNGTVLVIGGQDQSGAYLSSTEIYNPLSNSFSAGPSMSYPRSGASIVTLLDGRSIIAGGAFRYVNGNYTDMENNCEIFSPYTMLFSAS